MSVNEEIQVAYNVGLKAGVELGQRQGATAAYADIQAWALERLNNMPPYADPRTAQDLLDYCNARLAEAQTRVPSIDSREDEDGTQPESRQGQ